MHWNLTQMRDHNKETNGEYITPLLALKKLEGSWNSLTQGLSPEELADMDQARNRLRHYESIYEIFEYCEDLNR